MGRVVGSGEERSERGTRCRGVQGQGQRQIRGLDRCLLPPGGQWATSGTGNSSSCPLTSRRSNLVVFHGGAGFLIRMAG